MEIVKSTLSCLIEDGVATITLKGEHIEDILQVQRVARDLFDLVTESTFTQAILRFDNVSFVASPFFGKLIIFRKRLREANRGLSVCGMQPHVAQAFRMLNLHRLIPMFETLDDAKTNAKKEEGMRGS